MSPAVAKNADHAPFFITRNLSRSVVKRGSKGEITKISNIAVSVFLIYSLDGTNVYGARCKRWGV